MIVGISERRAAHAKDIIPWRADLDAARSEALASHRPVFAYFTAIWCPPCQAMKRTTWADHAVKQAMEKLVPVKIDVDAHPEIALKFGIDAMPTFVIISEHGDIVRKSFGLVSPEEMVDWLEK